MEQRAYDADEYVVVRRRGRRARVLDEVQPRVERTRDRLDERRGRVVAGGSPCVKMIAPAGAGAGVRRYAEELWAHNP